jgi:type II secretory pathway component PulF
MVRMSHASRFLFGLGLSLRAKVPAAEAVEMAGEATAGKLRYDAQRMRRAVEQGKGVCQALQVSPLFRGETGVLLSLAEWRGALPDECVALAEELRAAAERSATRMAAVTEYGCNVLIGIIIALFVIACYLPLFYIPNMIK